MKGTYFPVVGLRRRRFQISVSFVRVSEVGLLILASDWRQLKRGTFQNSEVAPGNSTAKCQAPKHRNHIGRYLHSALDESRSF